MVTKSSSDYIAHGAWFRDVVGGTGLVLCHRSALECLELFNGYFDESRIYVYAKEKGEYENIIYHVVDTFDNIEIVKRGNLLCTSISQTVNDMLDNFDYTDEQALLESLYCYYYTHGESFDSIIIKPKHIKLFNEVRQWALDYYTED